MSDWHGWTVDGKTLYVIPIPTRKGIAICIGEGAETRTMAYFKTEQHAREVLDMIDKLVFAKEVNHG